MACARPREPERFLTRAADPLHHAVNVEIERADRIAIELPQEQTTAATEVIEVSMTKT